MLLTIPEVLGSEQLANVHYLLKEAEWVDGRVTAGHQSSKAKNNLQIPENHPVAARIGEMIVSSLERHPLFISAALPLKVFPPLFNRYEGGNAFGTHVDNAIRQVPGTPFRMRIDLSATLFLVDPSQYDGGDLVIEDTYGVHSIKLGAGDMVLYPATSLHHVRPVTRGVRITSFFWVQSMVRDDLLRSQLFEMDCAIQQLTKDTPDHPSLIRLTGVYHNLLRQFAEI